MGIVTTSKDNRDSFKEKKRSRSVSSHSSGSSRSRSRSSSRSSRSSSSSSTSHSSSSRSHSRSPSSHSSRSSSSKSSGYRRRRGGGDRDRNRPGPSGPGGDSPRHITKKRSSSPRPTRLYIGRLTRNVKTDHLHEIFSSFGKVTNVEMPMDRTHHHLNRGFAYVEFESAEDAAKAVKYMDGGQIDGQEISASKIDLQKARGTLAPPPPRRNPPGWRQSPPIRRRRSPLPRRSPPRRRSRSPPIRDRRRRSSRSSSGSSR